MFLCLFFLAIPVSAIIPGQTNFLPQDPYHSCEKTEECTRRLNSIYPPYKFVCCSTIVCDKDNGYYLISSGCTTENDCKQVAFQGPTRFAARLHKDSWDTIANGLQNDCPKTSELVNRIPNITFTKSEERPADIQKFTENVHKREAVEKPRHSCSNGEQSCISIECEETLQKGANYRLQERCAKNCTSMGFVIPPMSHYQFSSAEWSLRKQYETSEKAPIVENSCRETRFFYYWLQKQQKTVTHSDGDNQ